MPFVLELASNDMIHIGRATVTNAGDRVKLVIDGDLPILKQRDYIPPASATTPAERLYVAIQEAYLSGAEIGSLNVTSTVHDLLVERPDARGQIAEISAFVEGKQLFKALKVARALLKTWAPAQRAGYRKP